MKAFVEWNGGSVFSADGRVLRYLALVLICFLTLGSYFVYDIPGAIQQSLQNYYDIDNVSYGLLYSVYSWPNCVQVFFGGYIVDRYLGVRLGALVFGGLVLGGQIIWALSTTAKSFPLAIVGRVVFGLGGETLGVVQSIFTAKYFRGRELAFAFGIALSCARLGSALNLNITPWVVKASGVPLALWVGVAVCVASIACALLLAWIDKYMEKRSTLPLTVESEQPPKLSDVRHFPLTLWLIFFICVTFYISVFILIQFGGKFVQHRFSLSQERAGSIVSLPYIVSAIASPLLGAGVDVTGRALAWIIAASALLMCCHFAFYLLPPATVVAYVIFVLVGVAYSVCAAALWPCVSYAVDENLLGTAYGLMTAIQNLGLALGSLGVGYLLQVTDNDYSVMETVFGCCSALSCLLALALFYVDFSRGSVLNASAARLAELAALKKAELAAVLATADDNATLPLLGGANE